MRPRGRMGVPSRRCARSLLELHARDGPQPASVASKAPSAKTFLQQYTGFSVRYPPYGYRPVLLGYILTHGYPSNRGFLAPPRKVIPLTLPGVPIVCKSYDRLPRTVAQNTRLG